MWEALTETGFEESMIKAKSSLRTIADMLAVGSMSLGSNPNVPWAIEPILENENCSIGLVKIKSDQALPCEAHVHEYSNEYLIVTKGKLLLHINDKAVRVLDAGDCASIPKDTLHFSQPLDPDTELVYVCVPRDRKIPLPI